MHIKILMSDILSANGQILQINPDHVESFQFATPKDIITVSDTERQLGASYLNFTLKFKDGYGPSWVDQVDKKGEN